MKPWAATFILCATPTFGDVLFEDYSDALPDHEYTGGWEHFVGGGVSVFDCNADGLPDIFAPGGTGDASLFINDGAFTFTKADFPPLEHVTGAYPIDINADSWTDLFVLRVGRNIVLKGGPDCHFAPAEQDWQPGEAEQWSTAFTAWWESNDPRPVLAVGNYVDRKNESGPFEACDSNELLRPGPLGYKSEVLAPGFCPLSILAAEDARGQMTLRLSNDRHYYVRDGYEQMWDIKSRRFLDESDGWGKVALWGMGIASRDLTGDGRDEVMLTSMGDQLLQIAGEDGTYTSAPYAIGTYAQRPHIGDDGRPSTGWHAEFGDVNNDGLADLFIAKGNVDQMPGMATRDPNNLLIQQKDGTFIEQSVSAGVASVARSRGGAFADFDNDGRLDLVVSNRRAPLELYRNVTPKSGNWFRVDLHQAGGNRHAIGARITVTSEDTIQSVQRIIGGGHAGGQLLPLHFGIGTASSAKVAIRWPDGSLSQLTARSGITYRVDKP